MFAPEQKRSQHETAISFVNTLKEQIIMFETAVQGKSSGVLWGIIIGCAALVVMLGTGYILIA